MCCLFAVILFLGPRMGILVWWLLDQNRWERAFDSFAWALLGFIFLPWTTLMFVLVGVGELTGFDWIWMGIALFMDLSSYSGGIFKRDRGMTYVTSYRR